MSESVPGRLKKLIRSLQLGRAIDICRGLGPALGIRTILKVVEARALRRNFMDLDLPALKLRVRLRTRSSDFEVFRQIFIERQYDTDGMSQAKDLQLKEAASESRLTIIDCGANIGCSALWFASQFPGARIVAIEPDEENFKLLSHNTRGVANLQAVRAAVWSKKTDVVISNPGETEWAYRTVASDSSVGVLDTTSVATIPTVTVAEFVKPSLHGRCIVKIDIEGAEGALFAENYEWLDEVDVVCIELHDYMLPWQGTSRNFIAAISSRPWDLLWRGENLFCFRDRSV